MQKKTGLLAIRILRIVGIVAAAVVFVSLAYYWLGARNADITRLESGVSVPTAAHFDDDVSAIISDNIPDVNNNRNLVAASPVRISYEVASGPYNPAFKSDVTQSELAQNVKITPAVHGHWFMPNSYELEFRPDQDWSAATKFEVKINQKLFSNDVRPDTRKVSFETAPIRAKTDIFNIYPMPGGDKYVVGVAVISFDYPIQTRDFADKVVMKLDGRRVDFTVKFDRYMRTAIIRTAPIQVTDKTQSLRLKINRIFDADGKSRTEKITAKIVIDAADNFFKVSDLTSITADNKHGNPQQLLLVNMTAAAKSNTNWTRYITAYLLPRNAETDEDADSHVWANDEVNESVLQKSKKLELEKVDFVNPAGTYQYAFAYEVSDNVPRYLYVSIKPNIKSANGFETKDGLSTVLEVAYPKRSVKIAGSGALLSLAGDRQLGIVARGGVDTAYVNLYKIESGEINHLVTQTYNLFSDLEFRAPWVFDAYDMSAVFQKKIPFANTSMTNVNYASINLGEYLDRTYDDKTGIFIVKTGASEVSAEYGDARLIILTDLGIIRKINFDKTSVVFVSRLSTGAPALGVDVQVLGRNGYPIWAGTTNDYGYVDIPYFSWSEYQNEKAPVAIVARDDSDVSFIPYNADSHETAEYSKFDVGGAYTSDQTPLKSFIFSDRGIYRPGEAVTLGAIVENKNFTSVADIPVKIEISDSRGRTIFDKKVSLPADGMIDMEYKLSPDASIGRYDVGIYSLNGRGRVQDTIGTGSFTVQEFVPDTMKIMATLNNADQGGWIAPENITANVALNNLYGTPATNRRISVAATLRPSDFTFDKYREYKFTTNFTANDSVSKGFARNAQTFTTNMDDIRTDENGNAIINVKFDRKIPVGTYTLSLNIHGFEAGDGKSIQTMITSRVSNLDYLVGYHADGDLSYVKRGDARRIKFIAIDNQTDSVNADNLVMKLSRRDDLTSLVKDTNNQYKYQTVSRDTVVRESQITIAKTGTEFELDTKAGGTYHLQILDSNDNILTNIEYFVASDENVEMNTTTRAELKIKLDAAEYKPGDTINIGITAPYTGTGLITIERDRVYASKWFNAKTTTSTQKITIPADFEGTGYVNVSFVRDINSRDVFTTPYTYAVAPFATKTDNHKIKVKLEAPEIVRDNKLSIKYSTDTDASLMIFAVNSGILSVANYTIPNPIKYFFQKAALQVETTQILSLLMPEYNVLHEVAKTGGGDFADGAFGEIGPQLTNPFGRKNIPSVAFYSGILKTKANDAGEITFDIPEYFNGALSIYAVAADTGKIGAANIATRVQSPVIISVSAPTFVAPNDKFTVNTIISNMTPESGTGATARNDASVTGPIIATRNTASTIEIPENAEKLWAFDIAAEPQPGAAEIHVSTSLFNDKDIPIAARRTTATLSVRPATMHRTDIYSGVIRGAKTNIRHIKNDMFDSESSRTLYISNSPSVLARPLIKYLENYEYDCTEQLVSKTLPFVLLGDDKIVGFNADKVKNKTAETVRTLGNRQNTDGSFGMWYAGNYSTENSVSPETIYMSAYVMNFMTLARHYGAVVPQSMFSRGIDFLRTVAGEVPTSKSDAVAKAFAVYVLSSNDYVTTSYIESIEEYANENIKNWRETTIGLYIAASYKMLKQTDKAYNLVSKYRLGAEPGEADIFDNMVANDALYELISRKYFDMNSAHLADSITDYINAGYYDSFTAAAIISGIVGGNNSENSDVDSISVFANDRPVEVITNAASLSAQIPFGTDRIRIDCAGCKTKSPLFYAFVAQGFPKTTTPISNGIEITRHYYDINGDKINSGNIGDMVDVKITVRTRGTTDYISNAVISDLLPGGFVPVADSIVGEQEFSEIREDRVLIYTDLSRSPKTFTYRAQLTNSGEFAVPAITANDMYNSEIVAIGVAGKFTVSNAAQ